MSHVPRAVCSSYSIDPDHLHPIAGGLINETYRVDGPTPAVLQRLHPIFAGEVNIDIEAITRHLVARGLPTPTLIRTTDDRLWVEVDGAVWRLMSFVDGHTVDKLDDPRMAHSAGALVGRFHHALADLDHAFAFARAGVHDTEAHLAGLAAAVEPGHDAAPLAAEIAEFAASRPVWGDLPLRVCHGDLKISNIRFAALTPPKASCLLDLDTLGRQPLPHELGDAFRSWCNPNREDQPPAFRIDLFREGMRGYAESIQGVVGCDEIEAIPAGVETICVELAARFCRDVFEDTYFGWDVSRYPSRAAHNLARARAQLGLARLVRDARNELQDVVEEVVS